MAIYLCYGCDKLMDSDDGCYESMMAKLKEKGERQFENVCEDCHESEVEELKHCWCKTELGGNMLACCHCTDTMVNPHKDGMPPIVHMDLSKHEEK